MLRLCPRHTFGQEWVRSGSRQEGLLALCSAVCGAAACKHAVGPADGGWLNQCSSCNAFHPGMRRALISPALQHLSTGSSFHRTAPNTQQASAWSGPRDVPPHGAHANEPDSRMLGLPHISAAARNVAGRAWQLPEAACNSSKETRRQLCPLACSSMPPAQGGTHRLWQRGSHQGPRTVARAL